MQGDSRHIAGVCPSHINRRRDAFTLVELLVVIGIIALLISILLPALSKAKELANRTACESKLKQIILAAQLHASDHQGYYPLVGVIPGQQPPDLDDTYSTKYSYYPPDPTNGINERFIAPITFALSLELSHRNVLNNSSNSYLDPEETDAQGFIKNFLCPSQGSSIDMYLQLPLLYVASAASDDNGLTVAYTEAMSYDFNEAICGWGDANTTGRLKGKVSLIRQPALTMFACDGLQGSVPEPRVPLSGYWDTLPAPPSGMAALYNIAASPNIGSLPPVTMADALTDDGKAGDSDNFDQKRHMGKINIAFCDGHVESRNITVKDLIKVFLLAP